MSECRNGTPLAAAALAPGLLKHGKEVNINHFHYSLAHMPVRASRKRQRNGMGFA